MNTYGKQITNERGDRLITLNNDSPNFLKDIDILYEATGDYNSKNKKQYHSFYRILYFKEISTCVKYEEQVYEIRKNQVMIIKPNSVYEIIGDTKKIKYYDFAFLDKNYNYNIETLFKHQSVYTINELSFFNQCFEIATAEAKEALGAKILLLSGIGLILLSLIFRNGYNNKLENYGENTLVKRDNIILMERIEEYLRKDFISNSKINNLAYNVGVSENKLYKLVKETYGLPPKEWIMQIKIQKVKILLAEKKSYQEIAELLDFCSVSHLGCVFKKYVGCTPNEYLKGYTNK